MQARASAEVGVDRETKSAQQQGKIRNEIFLYSWRIWKGSSFKTVKELSPRSIILDGFAVEARTNSVYGCEKQTVYRPGTRSSRRPS
jgi:hypothetical protein